MRHEPAGTVVREITLGWVNYNEGGLDVVAISDSSVCVTGYTRCGNNPVDVLLLEISCPAGGLWGYTQEKKRLY